MAYVAVSASPIHVHETGNRPDQGLPGGPPDYPSQGLPGGGYVDNTLPVPPPSTWPPPNFTRPIVPIYPPGSVPPGTIWPPPGRPVDPGYGRPDWGPADPDYGRPEGGRPDQGLPERPGRPPRPGQGLPGGGRPDQGLPGGGEVDNTLPGGGTIDNTLPSGPGRPDQGLPSQTFWVVAGIPGLGWRYVCVDPSLTIGHPLPPAPEPK